MRRIDHSSVSRVRAFTLLELLVAMAILAIVTVLAWRGLDQVTRARNNILSFLSEERGITQFFDQFRYDADSVVPDHDLNDPPVQLATGEMRLVRRLYRPDAAPRLEVVRYRLEGSRLVRYASGPLATLGQVHTKLGEDLTDNTNWSSRALSETLEGAQLKAYVPGSGWTERQDDLVAASEASRTAPSIASGVATPVGRTVTGLLLQIQGPTMRAPLTRVVMVGG